MRYNEIIEVLNMYFTEEEIIYLVNMNNMVLKAELLVNRFFENKFAKDDQPYIQHLYNVAQKQVNSIDKTAALLHHVLEDVPKMNIDILEFLRIPQEVIEIIQLVSKCESLTYDQEISRVISSANLGAVNVKYADLLDEIDSKNKNQSLVRLCRLLKINDE